MNNMSTMTPQQMDKHLEAAERELARARAAAEAQRQADAQQAAAQEALRLEREAAEAAELEKREALWRAETAAAAKLEETKRDIEALRLAGLRQEAERAAAGLLSRAEEDYLRFGPGDGDLRSSSDDELRLQSARVMLQLLGLDVPAELFEIVEPGSIAEVWFLGAAWTITFTPAEGAYLFLSDPRPAQDHGGASVNVVPITSLATLWRVAQESNGLAELKATYGAAPSSGPLFDQDEVAS